MSFVAILVAFAVLYLLWKLLKGIFWLAIIIGLCVFFFHVVGFVIGAVLLGCYALYNY